MRPQDKAAVVMMAVAVALWVMLAWWGTMPGTATASANLIGFTVLGASMVLALAAIVFVCTGPDQ